MIPRRYQDHSSSPSSTSRNVNIDPFSLSNHSNDSNNHRYDVRNTGDAEQESEWKHHYLKLIRENSMLKRELNEMRERHDRTLNTLEDYKRRLRSYEKMYQLSNSNNADAGRQSVAYSSSNFIPEQPSESVLNLGQPLQNHRSPVTKFNSTPRQKYNVYSQKKKSIVSRNVSSVQQSYTSRKIQPDELGFNFSNSNTSITPSSSSPSQNNSHDDNSTDNNHDDEHEREVRRLQEEEDRKLALMLQQEIENELDLDDTLSSFSNLAVSADHERSRAVGTTSIPNLITSSSSSNNLFSTDRVSQEPMMLRTLGLNLQLSDDASYEQLLALDEQIVKVGVSSEKLRQYPTHKYRTRSMLSPQEEPDVKCMICYDEYEDGVSLKRIPCMHSFHAQCIDKWFKENHRCPICQFDVNE